jgi:AcrR family transcriptional regulator
MRKTVNKPQRRSQQERRDATAAILINATIDLLQDKGYAALRTRDVTRYAKVTWGAVQHLFGDKNELLLQVIQHASDELLRDLALTIDRHSTLEERLHAAIESTWNAYGSRAYFAMVEIVRGTRAEPKLHERIVAMQQRVRTRVAKMWLEIFHDAQVPPARVQQVTELVTLSLSGLAARKIYLWSEASANNTLKLLEEVALSALRPVPRSRSR